MSSYPETVVDHLEETSAIGAELDKQVARPGAAEWCPLDRVSHRRSGLRRHRLGGGQEIQLAQGGPDPFWAIRCGFRFNQFTGALTDAIWSSDR
ncbi:hypothetical protein ACFYU5_26675 [Nocardia aobensis]|uniref:Uncharacterized protein n=1 Tax=Nocardia aobensis TaxID=257277 RepID=A0ABW6PA27_9NOCA